MERDCDVLVVGSGAGGGTLAYACARAGKSVVLLERGQSYPLEQAHDEQAVMIEKRPFDDRPVELNGASRRLYIGGVLGGGTVLYGAALLRPSIDDFHPGRHYGQRIPRSIWDWPVSYNQLEPYYDQAEALYGVAGNDGDSLTPLQQPATGYRHEPMPLHPLNQKLIAANRSAGLRPFQLPLAIDTGRCLRCQTCAGFPCPTGAKRTSDHLIERAIREKLPIRVETNVEVDQITTTGNDKVTGIVARNRTTGKTRVFTAGKYVLSAGAMGSPMILLKSGLGGPLVGRNYMPHLCPLVVGIFTCPTGAEDTFVKQVGFADYYFGVDGFNHKLGLMQSLPVPGPLLLKKTSPRWLPRAVQPMLRRRMLPMTGIIEDLPNPANRVSVGSDGRPRLQHRFNDYDRERGRQLASAMGQILKRAGAAFCLTKGFPSDEHVAHQCGTLRFGSDSEGAVLDPDCRVFGQPDLFVVDGSFLPTSLGIGPALTIMANALRVAGVVVKEV